MLPPACARIEPDVDDVDQEVGAQHGERDGQEEALHERVVEAAHRLEEQVALARVREDDLGEQRARRARSRAPCRSGDVGQERVARGVAEHHAPRRQALGVRQRDVVLAEHAHHGVAHAEHPAAEGGDHDGERRQHRVGDDAPHERRGSRPALTRLVVGVAHREPARARSRTRTAAASPARSTGSAPSEDEQRRRDRVEPAAATPRGEMPSSVPSAKLDDHRHAGEEQRPDQRRSPMTSPTRRREVADRDAEVAAERRGRGTTRYCCHSGSSEKPNVSRSASIASRLELAVEAREHRRRRIARHEPRDDERERQRRPARRPGRSRSVAAGISSRHQPGEHEQRLRARGWATAARTGCPASGKPVKRVVLYSPHSGPGNSGIAGACSTNRRCSSPMSRLLLAGIGGLLERAQQHVGLGRAEAVPVLRRGDSPSGLTRRGRHHRAVEAVRRRVRLGPADRQREVAVLHLLVPGVEVVAPSCARRCRPRAGRARSPASARTQSDQPDGTLDRRPASASRRASRRMPSSPRGRPASSSSAAARAGSWLDPVAGRDRARDRV